MTLLGGRASFIGPVIGAAFYTWLQETVSLFWDRWPMVLGIVFALVVLFFRTGVIGIVEAGRSPGKRRIPRAEEEAGGAMSAILRCIDLSKHFGAVKAISHVNLDVAQGALHAIIGPNGAGKTTLFNCTTGEMEPTSGEVVFEGQTISGKRPYELPPLGISRSFQRTSVFANMTVCENVWFSAFPKYAKRGVELFRQPIRMPRSATR